MIKHELQFFFSHEFDPDFHKTVCEPYKSCPK